MEYFYCLILYLSSFFLSAASLALYRAFPAAWLSDYGEYPSLVQGTAGRSRDRGEAWMVMTLAGLGVFLAATGRELPGSLAIGAVETVFLAAAYLFLMAAALSDRDFFIIPDQCCAALLFLAALRSLLPGRAKPAEALAGMFLAAGMVLLSMILSLALTRRHDSVGMGDLKFMGSAGACVAVMYGQDWMAAVVTFYVIAILSSAAWFSVLLLTRRSRYGDLQPMGPWIAGAALFCMTAGI